ncbi:unnamed protein product, partial [Hapterophycus canaliculatus]
MSSAIIVLVCMALPLAFTFRAKTSSGSTGRSSLPERTAQNIHWRRRLQHATCGLSIVGGYLWVITDTRAVVALLSFSGAALLVLHHLRRCAKSVDDLYLRFIGPLLRPHEIRGELPGGFWYLLGAAGAVWLFPRVVALQSILHLSLGDPVASVVGIRSGDRYRVLPAGKSLAGTFAAFLVCLLSTLLLFGSCCFQPPGEDECSAYHGGESNRDCSGSASRSSSALFDIFGAFTVPGCDAVGSSNPGRSLSLLLWYALLGGVSGAVGEFLPLGVDDNLSMPIASGVIFLALAACT